MPSPELKPCPFCGAEADVVSAPSLYDGRIPAKFAAFCLVCECATSWKPTPTEAIAAWNRRARKGAK